MPPATFTCRDCAAEFSLPEAVLAKYPGWNPKQCMPCRDKAKSASGEAASDRGRPARKATSRPTISATENLTLAQVLERFEGGPQDGVFTDGGCRPNPGPGGWGVVWVRGGEIVAQRHGSDPDTTNNRMELTAVIEAFKLLPREEKTTVHSDSDLVVKTVNEWARSWEKNGWKRKTGAIANLDLVKELWALVKERPNARLVWLAAHDGSRWNEYADSLAGAFARDSL